MFSNFSTPVWSGTATQSDNTDYSLSGTSRHVTFASAGETAVLSFDSVDISGYDEITFYINFSDRIYLTTQDRLKITVDADEFTIDTDKIEPGWNHFTIDAAAYSSLSSITFTGLADELEVLIDLIGYRKVTTATMDTDVTDAIIDEVSLNYGISTTISSDIAAGSSAISFTDHSYIFDRTQLTITNGIESETVQLNKRDKINGTFTYSYTSGDTVTANCPTVGEDQIGEEPDPVCGVMITNKEPMRDDWSEQLLNSAKDKDHTSELEIMVYVECTSKLRVLDLSNQFNKDYGEQFNIILDGEIRECILDNSVYNDGTKDTFPRVSYYYKIKPQPATITKRIDISTFTINQESK